MFLDREILKILSTSGLVVIFLIRYEIHLRTKVQKFRRSTNQGQYKSQLSDLPYSEKDFNENWKNFARQNKLKKFAYENKLNYTSPGLNFTDGIRKTSFILNSNLNSTKIYLFGGSTIACANTPDDYTIASRLQNLLNQSPPPLFSLSKKFEVVNYGVDGASLKFNSECFSNSQITNGDIAIFYFGANEINYSHHVLKVKFPFSLIPNYYRIGESLYTKFGLHSLKRFLEKTVIVDVGNLFFNQRANEIREMLMEINSYCAEKSIRFISVLQPFLGTKNNLTGLESFRLKFFPKTQIAVRQALNNAITRKMKNEPFFLNASSLFDTTDLDIYIDWCHTNHLGNQLISQYFYSLISTDLSSPEVI